MIKNKTVEPLVSCIMPTYNRLRFVPLAIRYFLRQDYPNRELIIIDDGTDSVNEIIPDDSRICYLHLELKSSVGAKRNLACRMAKGEIIAHWDDDDWIAPWRLSYQIDKLFRERAEICGLDRILYFNSENGKSWQYTYPKGQKSWLAGGTLCYTRDYWSQAPFPDINVGEDASFLWSRSSGKILALNDSTFYIAMIHPGNTSPKHTEDSCWRQYSTDEVREIMGHDWKDLSYPVHDKTCVTACHLEETAKEMDRGVKMPLVSCILLTYNRRYFLPRAIKYFLRQDYPDKELIIVDDGINPADDLIPRDPSIRHLSLPARQSIGAKRNIGVEASRGEIIILWDDDDWHGANRISYQVKSIIGEKADATVLQDGLVFDSVKGRFWKCRPALRDRMFAFGVIGGTVAFRKTLFDRMIRFPSVNLAEDAEFLRLIERHRLRLKKMPANDTFIYIRHRQNTWVFSEQQSFDYGGWEEADPPGFMPSDDLDFYLLKGDDKQVQYTTAAQHEPKTRHDKFMSGPVPVLSDNINLNNRTSMGPLDCIKYLNTGNGSLLEDYMFLYGITRLLRPGLILEIGTNTGVSAIVFAKAICDSGIAGQIITLEYDEAVLEIARKQIQTEGLDEFIEIIEGKSEDLLSEILQKYLRFDLCFLDGDHSYSRVKEEFELIRRHCRYILLHDSQSFEGVKKLADELRECRDCRVVLLSYPPGEQWSEGKVVLRSNPGIALVEVVA